MKQFNNEYYVYIYLDIRYSGEYKYEEYEFNYKPFYVGKGKNKRKYSHLKMKDTHNKHKNNIIKKIFELNTIPEIITIKENMSEEEAFELEKKLVKLIGRENIGTGHLTNLTDAGEGTSGAIWSDESKEKIKGENNSFFNKTHTDDTINKVIANSKKRIGKKWEEIMGEDKAKELKKQYSEDRKGRNNPNHINKNRSLEEICGEEKAKQLKESWSKSHTGMKYSEETNKKKGQKGDKNYFHNNPMNGSKNGRAVKLLVLKPNKEQIVVHGNIKNFCKENNLSYKILSQLRKKEIDEFNGWKVVELAKGDDSKQFQEV